MIQFSLSKNQQPATSEYASLAIVTTKLQKKLNLLHFLWMIWCIAQSAFLVWYCKRGFTFVIFWIFACSICSLSLWQTVSLRYKPCRDVDCLVFSLQNSTRVVANTFRWDSSNYSDQSSTINMINKNSISLTPHRSRAVHSTYRKWIILINFNVITIFYGKWKVKNKEWKFSAKPGSLQHTMHQFSKHYIQILAWMNLSIGQWAKNTQQNGLKDQLIYREAVAMLLFYEADMARWWQKLNFYLSSFYSLL